MDQKSIMIILEQGFKIRIRVPGRRVMKVVLEGEPVCAQRQSLRKPVAD